ncbi:MAG: hypothetical protein ACKVPX_17860 [Myxococcaceae bacterium]
MSAPDWVDRKGWKAWLTAGLTVACAGIGAFSGKPQAKDASGGSRGLIGGLVGLLASALAIWGVHSYYAPPISSSENKDTNPTEPPAKTNDGGPARGASNVTTPDTLDAKAPEASPTVATAPPETPTPAAAASATPGEQMFRVFKDLKNKRGVHDFGSVVPDAVDVLRARDIPQSVCIGATHAANGNGAGRFIACKVQARNGDGAPPVPLALVFRKGKTNIEDWTISSSSPALNGFQFGSAAFPVLKQLLQTGELDDGAGHRLQLLPLPKLRDLESPLRIGKTPSGGSNGKSGGAPVTAVKPRQAEPPRPNGDRLKSPVAVAEARSPRPERPAPPPAQFDRAALEAKRARGKERHRRRYDRLKPSPPPTQIVAAGVSPGGDEVAGPAQPRRRLIARLLSWLPFG